MSLSATEDLFIGATIFIIAIGGLLMNVQLLFKIKKRASKKPDEMVNKLYLSLAITHILLIFTVMPLSSSASLTRNWMWGDIGCTYYGFMGIFLGNVMILTMLSICVDLFFETNLLHYDWSQRETTTLVMLAFSWIFSLITAVVPLFGWSSYSKEPTGLSCTTVSIASEYFSYLTYIFFVTWFVYMMPIFGMICCYFLIGTSSSEKKLVSYNSKKILILLILLLIEWGPYTTYYLWPMFSDDIPLWLNAVSPLFGKSSTILTTFVLWDLVDNHEIPKVDDED